MPIRDDAAIDVLRAALVAAGDRALSLVSDLTPERKPDGTLVTEADRIAEDVLVTHLAAAFPGTAIVGEEGVDVPGQGGTWYVDPLDGTEAMLEGLAHWGPTVALFDAEGPVVGAFYTPMTRTFWWAARGRGAWRGDVRLIPPVLDRVRRSAVAYVPSRFHQVGPVPWPGKVRALGSTAAHLAAAASGAASVSLVATWRPWDVGCGALLVTEANRGIVGLDGTPGLPSEDSGAPFLAGDPTAIAALRDALRRSGGEGR